MELNYVRLGKRIAQRRKQLNLKQNVLAEMLGISNNYLSSIECGKERPSLEIIVNICNKLQVTPDYLLLGNMYSNNIPQNITDGLKLCSTQDVELLNSIMQILISRHSQNWNSDNFV